MLSSATMSAWAKTDRDGGRLSLVRHLADSAEVAKLVWDEWLPPHTRRAMSANLGDEEGRAVLCWLAAVHDLGKLTPAFACQVRDLAETMADRGLKFPAALSNRKALPHGLAGQVAITAVLVERGWTKAAADSFGVVVGSHHGVPPTEREADSGANQIDLLGRAEWDKSRRELLDFVTERTAGWDRVDRWRHSPLSLTQQALFTAAVIVADWIASNQDLFPLDEARASSTAAPLAWQVLGLPPPWLPQPVPLQNISEVQRFVRSRFGWPESVQARPLQAECVRLAAALPEPGLMVVEAPMGEGKTEAALAAAELLAQRFGFGGVFVALPTMATSDAMFGRVHRWVENLPDTPSTMFLAHGRAALNKDFAELRSAGFDSIGVDCVDSGVTAHAWYVGKKGPLADIVVGTIDQVLRAALKTRHVMLRHLGLANKVVIVDEVHAADSYMSTYLCRALEWLGAYRVPVILLSATLPPAQRDLLVRAYQRGRGDVECAIEAEAGYPAVTVWPHSELGGPVAASGRSIAGIAIEPIEDDASGLANRLRAELAAGGVAGVVCNTVARAQETYTALVDGGFEEAEVLLVHSRFVAGHRAELEEKLRAALGPAGGGARRPARFVVVGTQVIEQSLDIDVDLLVTDLAPVDLMLQRIGRLHRHRRDGRPTAVARPRCLVRGADWNAVPPEPVRGSEAVYGLSRLLRAALVLSLSTGRSVTVPDDVPGLVAAAYDEKVDPPIEWSDTIRSADEAWADHTAKQQRKARDYLLPGPASENPTVAGWLAHAIPDDAEGVGGQAQVRDAEDSLEAIVVQRCGSAVCALEQVPKIGGTPVPTETEPPSWLAKKLAASTIRLPAYLTRYGRKERMIRALEDTWYPGWQRSHWLAGELVLELDADGVANLVGYDLRYDPLLGLLAVPAAEDRSTP
ncbi:CRISPR-associated helicase Cas3' [Nocardia asteroides]|uniref:CRISPR-associated helicase Cas3' n=1 Tax=Nocardia asteroides TaxID=1824 RepID=UPI001E437993|nr:CRISPR-associated helicase Cas3' [Nocardia asteroides]UGT59940.1 CRISPR-associated helicase Cas3' [Nocardia asteroides]